MAVFVLDRRGKPLMPCSEKRARLLLTRGRARVHRVVPLQNPQISGVAYQQGTLAGYEVREYLLEQWGRRCAYCTGDGVPLEIDHITPRSRGGSDRVTNLTLACHPCNQAKGNRSAAEFGHPEIEAKAKQSLGDAAAVNSTRWSLLNALTATGLAVETGTGGRTKWNRTRLGVPKTHALDAACVGVVEGVTGWVAPVLSIRCTGRGTYQRTRVTQDGFPRGYLMRHKQVRGFQTGDLVRATVPSGKKAGVHMGRVAVRATGRFNIQTPQGVVQGVVQGIGYRHCCVIQRGDGYGYAQLDATALLPPAIPPRPEGRGFSRRSG